MPSRRRLLAGGGLTLAGAVTGWSVLADRSTTSGADWPMARYDAAGTGYGPDASGPKADPQLAWDASLERPGASDVGPPILVDGTLYAGTDELTAFDAETGAVRFSYGTRYGSSPARAPSSIYRTDTLAVGTTRGVVGLNAEGGRGVLGRRFGTERWRTQEGDSGSNFFGPPDATSPVTVGETVFAAFPGTGELAALEADNGRERWRRDLSTDDTFSATPRRPAVRDGTVFVTAWPQQLRAFDAETGDERWSEELEEQMVLAPTATDDAVVVPTRSGIVTYEADDGGVRWTRDLEGNATDGAAAVAEGTVFVTDDGSDGALHALDLETGDEEWSAAMGRGVSPVVADGVVYTTGGYELLGLDAETGDRLFSYESEWRFSPPSIGDGVLYIVDGDRVLALEENT